jgi:non-specific protein-tyrosine kinase
LELLTYWKIFRKRLLLIVLLILAAEFGAVFYVLSRVPLYSTTTTMIITPSAMGSLLSYQVNLTLGPLANTYIQYMGTRSFGEMVAARMPVEISTTEVLRSVTAEFVRDTQIFRITATHRNPEVAQMLANTTAQMLIDANTDRQLSQQEARLAAQRSPEALARQKQMNELIVVLQDELNYYDDQIRTLDSEIRNLEQGPQSVETTQRILDLRDRILQYRTERIGVLSSLAETQNALSSAFEEPKAEVDTIVVVDPALLPTEARQRDFLQPLVAALVAALALGFGLAWFLEYLDYTVKTPEELDELYGLPTQGAIAGLAGGNGDNARTAALIAATDPRSPAAEAFRALRTSIRMAGVDGPVRSLMVTSAGPGEGKTFVAGNLAVAFAQEGKRTLLVDLDLRKPQISTRFGVRREPGFSNLVVDRTLAVEHCMQATAVPNLFVIASGTIPPHPSELLGSTRAGEVIEQIKRLAEIVIFDTAPAATVTDALLVVPHMDGALQVVSAGTTRRDLVLRCRSLLERAGARLLGPVLNRVESGDLGYYANYYSYGGYYHESADKPKGGFWRGRGKHAEAESAGPEPDVKPAPAAGRRAGNRLAVERERAGKVDDGR